MSGTEKAARVFKVLSVDTRVRMIALLKRRFLCVNALARTLPGARVQACDVGAREHA